MAATFAVGVEGAVVPVQIYTSYEVAVAAVFQVNAAVELVASTAPLAGAVFVTQEGGNGVTAVVKLVWLALQPATGPKPLLFFGKTYHL